VTGGKNGVPATGLEGKFDLKYCVALALHGHTLSAADFREPLRLDPAVAATAARIEVDADAGYGFASARLQAEVDGESLAVEVPVAKGHPANPIRWSDMREKFFGLVDAGVQAPAEALFTRLREFGRTGKPDLLHHAADVARQAMA
jgi:2-methylcitrate dehydratase PrpD